VTSATQARPPCAAPGGEAAAITPARILDLSWGIARTGVLTAALDLDVFSHIAGGAATPGEVADRCGTDAAATATLLHCLASLGLLEAAGGDLPSYALAPDAAAFLVAGAPRYLGDMRHMHHAVNFRLWPQLAATVRAGAAADDLFGDDGSDVWAKVTPYLDQLAQANASWLTAHLGATLPADASVLDAGCGAGACSRLLAAASPGVHVLAIDREDLIGAMLDRAAGAGLAGQVEGRGGDLRDVAWGSGHHLVLLSNVLHGYDETGSIDLLRRARQALRPGGTVAIFEIVPDERRPLDNPVAAFFSLQMLMTSGGRAHTTEDYRRHLRAAGLGEPAVERCPAGPGTLLTATNPGSD
jgi:2-polyprenyl-3-methyl-5-hydroxy-6-metoxy-1,4-benzoquinol methylase